MTLRTRVKEMLPYWLTCAIARAINRPFLEDIHRSERIVEYAWVLSQVRGPRIMDFGWAGSYFAEMLCQFGTVLGVDPRETPTITHPNFQAVELLSEVADGWSDTIVCVSVLEHLPRWDAQRYGLELVRKLAPGGQLLITVPYGDEGPFEGYQPFSGLEIARWPGFGGQTIFTRLPTGGWSAAWSEDPGPNLTHCVRRVACVRLHRPTVTPDLLG